MTGLATSEPITTPRAHLLTVISEIAASRGVTYPEIVGDRGLKHISQARQEVMSELRDMGLTLVRIGLLLGGRDHTTVGHGIAAHHRRLGNKSPLRGGYHGSRRA